MKTENVAHKLAQLAQRYPDRKALVFPAKSSHGFAYREITFAQLHTDTNRLANSFQALGLAQGDRVVIMVPMSLDLYLVVIALLKVGAIAVFIDPWMGLDQVVRCCQLTQPKAFIGVFKAHLLRLLSRDIREIPIQIVTRGRSLFRQIKLERLLVEGESQFEAVAVSEDHPALLTFTTGSTGAPKGAVRTHSFLMAQHEVLTHHFGLTPQDVDLPVLPVFVLNNLANGITSIIPQVNPLKPSQVNPVWVVRQIQDHRITTSSGSPAFFWPVAQYCLTQNIRLENMRAIFTGGAPVRPELIEMLTKILPNGTAYVVYGSTEAEPISMISAQEILNETARLTKEGRGNCVGKPVKELEVRVIKACDGPIDFASIGANDRSLALPPGVIGEIIVTGRHVNKDYYKNPEAVRENKFTDERGCIWHRTGDTGYLDERGRLWLVGRVRNRMVRAGQEIHPLQIEPVIDQLPFVQRSAVVGVPDPRLGQKVALIVEAAQRGLLTRLIHQRDWKRQLEAFCREKQLPVDQIHFCRKIPLDPRHNAKINYAKLKRRFTA